MRSEEEENYRIAGTMADQHTVKLLGTRRSFYAMRVRIALQLKGVPYEFVEEDLRNKSQLLLQSNPIHKKIPVLIHNGNPISESLLILEYIDETWTGGAPLLPRHPYGRALSRFWASVVENKFNSALARIITGKGVEQERAKEEAVACLVILEGALATTSKGKPYFGGEEIGYLDIVLGSRAVLFKVIEEIGEVKLIDSENTPLLHVWIQHFSAHHFVNKFLPDMDELLSFFRGMRSRALGEGAYVG